MVKDMATGEITVGAAVISKTIWLKFGTHYSAPQKTLTVKQAKQLRDQINVAILELEPL